MPVRDFLLPARLVGGGSGIKLSLRAESGPKSALWGMRGEFCTGFGAWCGTKFSLLRVVGVEAVKSSPFLAKSRGNGPFGACGESFVPVGLLVWVCGESFVPGEPLDRLNRESFVPVGLLAGACLESFVPGVSMCARG